VGRQNNNQGRSDTSWQKVAPWYNKITKEGQGHYYHQHVVIPGVLRLLSLSPQSPQNILDLACGNGVLAQHLPKQVEYTGVDIAPGLIKEAKTFDHNSKHKYIIADISKPLITPNSQNPLTTSSFTHATIILALQNISNPEAVFQNISKLLLVNSKLVIVLNHPCFRIPRQSSWGIDTERKIQYRRIDKYMSPMEIPIRMNPSDPNSQKTLSYHFSLGDYSKMLKDAGFLIENIEEWTSDKESVGRAGKMENRSRSEIPLFMAIVAKKS
jgi:ubiquinone/menaquinone biosynthesis C-methylase UbiE